MFSYFFHGHCRKVIVAFGDLFSKIVIVRVDAAGRVNRIIPVPIRYAPSDKIVAAAREGGEDATDSLAKKFIQTFPRMAWETTGLEYDTERSKSQHLIYNKVIEGDDDSASFIKTPAPYKMSFDLRVVAKNQTDALQVVEQILPYFRPSFSVQIMNDPIPRHPKTIPFTLHGVAFDDTYEGSTDETRLVTYTLSFSAPVDFFGPASTPYESAVQKAVGASSLPASNSNVRYDPSVQPFIAEMIIRDVDEGGNVLDTTTTTFEPEDAKTHDEVEEFVVEVT